MVAAPCSYPHLPARNCRATERPGTPCNSCKCVTSGTMRNAIAHKCLRCQSIAAADALAGARLPYALGDGR
eukprot:10757806-Alexandrium_andersonii.AAC.1